MNEYEALDERLQAIYSRYFLPLVNAYVKIKEEGVTSVFSLQEKNYLARQVTSPKVAENCDFDEISSGYAKVAKRANRNFQGDDRDT